MKRRLFLIEMLILCCISAYTQQNNVGINTPTPDPSAALHVEANDKGVLMPRLTTEQRQNILNAAVGLMVFDTDTESFWYRETAEWVELGAHTWEKNENNAYFNGGNIGIGLSNPQQKLDVAGAVKLGDTSTPIAGTIRWNPDTEDFEGYTGTRWKSLTDTGNKFWGNTNLMYTSTENNKLTAADGTAQDFFGASLSIAGDYVLIGASEEDSFKGSAYIFVRSGNGWIEKAKLTASDATTWSFFGASVSLSEDYALIGAPGRGGDLDHGAVYIFIRTGDTWIEQAKLMLFPGIICLSELTGMTPSK